MLDPTEALALAKFYSRSDESTTRDAVSSGSHDVDFTVHLKGKMKVGDDSTMMAVQKAKPWLLLAVALSKLNGVTIASLVREADAITQSQEKALKANVTSALESLKGKTKVARRGNVNTNGINLTKVVADPGWKRRAIMRGGAR